MQPWTLESVLVLYVCCVGCVLQCCAYVPSFGSSDDSSFAWAFHPRKLEGEHFSKMGCSLGLERADFIWRHRHCQSNVHKKMQKKSHMKKSSKWQKGCEVFGSQVYVRFRVLLASMHCKASTGRFRPCNARRIKKYQERQSSPDSTIGINLSNRFLCLIVNCHE